jgi:hypothetical protein
MLWVGELESRLFRSSGCLIFILLQISSLRTHRATPDVSLPSVRPYRFDMNIYLHSHSLESSPHLSLSLYIYMYIYISSLYVSARATRGPAA